MSVSASEEMLVGSVSFKLIEKTSNSRADVSPGEEELQYSNYNLTDDNTNKLSGYLVEVLNILFFIQIMSEWILLVLFNICNINIKVMFL